MCLSMASKFSCIVDASPIRSRSKQPANLDVVLGGNSHVVLHSNEMEAASPRNNDRKDIIGLDRNGSREAERMGVRDAKLGT